MTPYTEYRYLYPPRPEYKINPDDIGKYDNGLYVGQPKYNGACCNAFLPGDGTARVMGRERNDLTNVHREKIDFQAAHRGSGYMVLCGELLNKNQLGEGGKPFNQKFVIWDILVYEGQHLTGTTTRERLELLETLYGCNRMAVNGGLASYDHICTTPHMGIYKAPVYTKYFYSLYEDLARVPLYEGLVLKRAEARLAPGYQEKNNHEWQVKCRKETKNYKF